MTRVPCWANVSSCGSCLRHIGINPSTRHPQRLVGRVPSLCSLMHCKPACGCLQCMFCCVIAHVHTGALTAVACLHVSKCYSPQTNVLAYNHASEEFLGFRLYPTRVNLVATLAAAACRTATPMTYGETSSASGSGPGTRTVHLHTPSPPTVETQPESDSTCPFTSVCPG